MERIELLKLYKIHIVTSVVLSIIIAMFFSKIYTVSFLIGAAIILVNISALALVLKSAFDKKSVAWPILLIVFKYAILVLFLYIFSSRGWISLEAVGMGLGSLVVSAPIYAIFGAPKD